MSGIENDVLVAKNVNFDYLSNPPHNGIVSADGQLLIGSTANPNISMVANTLTQGSGILITNGPGTITIASTASLTDLHTARFIVASSTAGTGANFTTIASAIASAQGTGINSTIFLQPGTYTENFTLPPGINLCAYTCDAFTPNVTIVGTITMTAAGTCSISGIRLQTNSAFLLAVTGSAASVVNLDNCYLNCTNNTGISFTSSSASASINITDCQGNLGTTGIALFTQSSAGLLTFNNSSYTNSGGSTTNSTISAGVLTVNGSIFTSPITSSATGGLSLQNSQFITATLNVIAVTHGGSTSSVANLSRFGSGTASCISVSTSMSFNACTFSSSNTNCISGAGTANVNAAFTTVVVGTNSAIGSTTKTAYLCNLGAFTAFGQPAFSALNLAGIDTNVTGDGTSFTLGTGNAFLEIFDQNGDFNTNGTFTAPITGRYRFTGAAGILGLGATNTLGQFDLVTSNRTYTGDRSSYGAERTVGTGFNAFVNALTDMDAADTCTLIVTVSNGTKTVSIGTANSTYFNGSLEC